MDIVALREQGSGLVKASTTRRHILYFRIHYITITAAWEPSSEIAITVAGVAIRTVVELAGKANRPSFRRDGWNIVARIRRGWQAPRPRQQMNGRARHHQLVEHSCEA